MNLLVGGGFNSFIIFHIFREKNKREYSLSKEELISPTSFIIYTRNKNGEKNEKKKILDYM